MSRNVGWTKYLNPGSLYLPHPPELRGGPPFNFENVTSRVFPIKANMSRLTHFCDQYLNSHHEDEKSHVLFRPAVPYVYLMVINYGSMSPSAVNAQNLGWVAQREVTFTVPLEQWEKEDGEFVFKKWACVSPFIFVDDELSLTTGREVYGWPKAYARMETLPTLWSQDPRLDSRLFIMKTDMTFMPYAGQRERPLVLMEIDLAPRPTYSEFPPSPTNPWSPISIFSTAAEGSLRLIEDVTDMFLGLPIRGYRSKRDPATLLRMTETLGKNFMRLLPSYLWPLNDPNRSAARGDCPSECFVNHITLKQFRDAEHPEKACYQAIVSSSMGINRLNACGLLGDLYLLRGDPSGGFTIRLYRYTSQPIIETLGLEIDAEEGVARAEEFRREDIRKTTPVALIKPTFPFWTDVDLHYGKGDVISRRSDSQRLRTKEGTPCWLSKSQTDEDKRKQEKPERAPELPNYNTVQGVAVQAVTGPFRFPDLTLQVYPLLADRTKLEKYIGAYLNNPLQTPVQPVVGQAAELQFEPFGSYVYMVINTCDQQFGTMWSETNNIGWWADKDVSFCVPVKVYQKEGNNGKRLISLAMIAPFAYANSTRAVITDREVNGRNTARSVITCPPDAWLGPRGPASARKMLSMETQVFPALNLSQKSEMRTLLEITEQDASEEVARTSDRMTRTEGRLIGETWEVRRGEEGDRLAKIGGSLACQVSRMLALELMTQQNAFNFIYLKQYRGAEDPNSFCYQAYVNAVRTVHSVLEMQEILDPVLIRLHKYPDHNIRDALGLECLRMNSEGDSVVFVLEPISPFWMRLQINEELSNVLCSRSRSGKGEWKTDHAWFRTSDLKTWEEMSDDEQPYFQTPGRTAVGPGLLIYLDGCGSQREDDDSAWDDQTKASADIWLRKSLMLDLNKIIENVKRLWKQNSGKTPSTVSKRLSKGTREEVTSADWNLASLAASKSTGKLYWFVEELDFALEPERTQQPYRDLLLSVREELKVHLKAADKRVNLDKLKMRLPLARRKELFDEKGVLKEPLKKLAETKRLNELYPVVKDIVCTLEGDKAKILSDELMYARFTREEARAYVDALEDPKALTELIIREAWRLG